jgi:non-specific serine/threonine protein kinase
VPPLPLPDLSIAPTWQLIEQFPAVHLFVACARAVLPSFSLTPDNAGSIGLICARLDGLPLAIELIAARVRLMSPAKLAARLTRRLAMLNDQIQDRPMRQQTLAAAIAWSYDNLAPAEQRLFRWLSVFSGGADLSAIEAVCQEAVAPDDVIDLIAALLDKSMVRCTVVNDGDNRFGMLETISEYAREQLLLADEAAAAESAHARYYCQFIHTLQPQMRDRQNQLHALDRIAGELANLRAAMAWALANQPATAITAIEALCDFFDYRCYFSEACQWLERALESLTLSDLERARLLNRLGGFNWKQGDYAEATIYHEHALAVQERLGDEREVSRSLQNLAIIAGKQGDYARSRQLLERSLLIERAAEHLPAIGVILNNLAIIARHEGNYGQAEVLLSESLEIKRRSGERVGIAISLKNLGSVILLQGRVQEAADLFCQSLGLRQEIGDRFGIASSLEQLAGIAVQSDYAALAAQLLGAASHLRAQIGSPVAPDEQADYAAVLAQTRAVLDAATFESAWNAGVTQPLEETTTAALTLRRIAPATVAGRR